MITIRHIAVFLLLTCSFASAEYTMFKSKAGVLVISDNPGLYFLLDVPGENFRPVGMNEAPYPALEADGYFLQIVPGTVSELKMPEGASDRDILTAQYKYETDFHKISPQDAPMELSTLTNGKSCITWSMTPNGTEHKHYFLCFRSDDRVISICAADMTEPKAKGPFQLLKSIAESFYRSSSQLKISWDDAGDYHYKQ
jgi:hypothetical protein